MTVIDLPDFGADGDIHGERAQRHARDHAVGYLLLLGCVLYSVGLFVAGVVIGATW